MHTATKDLTTEIEIEGIHTRGEEWGGQLVRHIELGPGVDFAPVFQGLPDDRCQCAHWGYIVEGSIHVVYRDGSEEINRAGDLYYWPAGHTGYTPDGVVFIEFSVAEELRPVLEHIGRQLAGS